MPTLFIRFLAIGLFLLFLNGCAGIEPWWPYRGERGYGPPPHAPAHGYRYKHKHGKEMVFDSDLGVYVVTGYPGCYFYNKYYYRFNKGVWERCNLLNGPWTGVSAAKIPPGLQKGIGKKLKKKHRGKRK